MLGLWGAFAYLAWVVPQRLALDVAARFEKPRIYAILLAAASVVLMLPLKAATIGDGWSDALRGKTLAAVFFETSVGHIWRWETAATTILVATLLPALARRDTTATAAGLALVPLAFINHAAEREGWLGTTQRFNDALHLLAAGAWVGALVPLIFILSVRDNSRLCREAMIAVQRFSILGHAVVALVIATGIVNAFLILKEVPLRATSAYQILLAVKIALVVVMIGLALINRYGAKANLPIRHDAAAIRARTGTEIVLGAVVICLVAVFGLLDP